jgi:Ca-activated chloride channel family protein
MPCEPNAMTTTRLLPLPLLFLPLPSLLPAQIPDHWVSPGRTLAGAGVAAPVRVVAAAAHVAIRDRAATTTLQFELHNPGPRDQEAVLLVPVPVGAAVSQFAFHGPAPEPTAKLLSCEEARRLYDEITRRLQDPALLEFVGLQCLRTSVFPVPAGGRQAVRFVYDHVLAVDGYRVDYVLPRSELLASDVPWSITVDLQARDGIGVYHSPSHELEVTRRGADALQAQVAARSRRAPGPFRFSFMTTTDLAQPTAALLAYPDPAIGGGYFLLLANAPVAGPDLALRREVTLVLDRSGSMAGRKLEQAKAAALQVLAGLADGEGIQLLDYGNDVGRAFARPVAKSAATLAAARRYIESLRAHGGTNIHDALLEALRAEAMPEALPLVLFLTDGLPTVGPTSERELHAMVAAANRHQRRIFSFGVGHDVNVPLLDRLAEATRAVASYVLPEEDVDLQVARTFARLGRPVLAEPTLAAAADAEAGERLREVLPRQLPDLFAGDQLVVLGQYRGEAPLQFTLRGRAPQGEVCYQFALPVATASTAHAFVPRLWASRQIAYLVDELRQQAGDLGGAPGHGGSLPHPGLRELRDEILRLSTRFGVLTEYTAFLATEGSRLDDWPALAAACEHVLRGRAVAVRSGAGAVSQGSNLWAMKEQACANPRNAFYDAAMHVVETAAVQQVCDRTFLRRGNRWIDSNAVLAQQLAPDRRVVVGSADYFALVDRLAAEQSSGVLSLSGEILLRLDGGNVLVTAAAGALSPNQPYPVQETNR